jgi:murein DD-endopeptidase MepM/ murein hydrolase activator NlpD
MRVNQFGVRSVILGLTGSFIITTTPVFQGLWDRYLGHSRSLDLLYSSQSPFQNTPLLDSELNQSQNLSTSSAPLDPIPAEQPTKEQFKHTVKRGDTIASLWREFKGAPAAVQSFVKAFTAKKSALRAGEVVEVTRRGDEVVEVRRELGAGATLIISGDEQQGYNHRVEQALVHSGDRKVSGSIQTSLVDSALESDLPYSVVDDFVDLFGNRVDFRKDLHPGDSFTVWYEEKRLDNGKLLSTGAIKAASLSLSGKMYAVVRDVALDGTVRYFDEKGEMPTKSFLRYPVQFTRISSVFTHARFHPVLKVSRPHNGVDFAAPIGTPVRTVGDGVVVFAGYNRSGGNMIKIAHDSRYTTEYMHLSKIASNLKTGSKVTRGSVIGALGNTGLSSGPHLHFGLFDRGKYVDPMKAKIIQSAPEIKAPKAVLAMIAELRKTHQSIAVASASTTSSKKKA